MIAKKNHLFVTLATLLLSVAFAHAQSKVIKEMEQSFKKEDYASTISLSKKIKLNKISVLDKAKYNYILANIDSKSNKDDLAFNKYIEAKKLYKSIDSIDQVAKINVQVVSLLLALNKNDVDYKPYLEEYNDYAKSKNDSKIVTEFYIQIGKSFYDNLPKSSIVYFKKAEIENSKTKDILTHVRILQNIGATFTHHKINQIDSALYTYQKALKILKTAQYNKLNPDNIITYYFNIYTNMGLTYGKKKDFDKAFLYFKKADSIPIKHYINKNKEILYGYIAEAYKSKGDYKKALEYLDKKKVFEDYIDENEQQKFIKDIEVKYNTEATKQKNERLLKIIYSVLGLLLVIITIGLLVNKNLVKKKKIAEQEKLIQTQKLETALKEQELHEIDVMLESQEKERQRIANELHDNLGSLLATLKFNFQNIKHSSNTTDTANNELYQKTDDLLEEAYQEVRNIAHLKNLGVIGNQGLEAAVKKMAEKMSVLEKITFNVIPFGMTERLENSKEIILFRMIQELCTNIIKHSEATEVNIYLTQHKKTEINIIIEDNGKGFNPKKVTFKDGIGLRSIEKKVEQMGGTFTIDSVINNGTTIIIDLVL